jgi:hypothetical protein
VCRDIADLTFAANIAAPISGFTAGWGAGINNTIKAARGVKTGLGRVVAAICTQIAFIYIVTRALIRVQFKAVVTTANKVAVGGRAKLVTWFGPGGCRYQNGADLAAVTRIAHTVINTGVIYETTFAEICRSPIVQR